MPKTRVLATLFLVVFAATTLYSCNPETPKFAFNTTERRGKLPNGIRFVVMPDATTKLVELDVRYEVGSREDPPGKAGLAHLVEHLMFQARPDGADTAPLFKSINGLTTWFNANTEFDRTHYMDLARVENFDAMMKIESMRMFFGCQTIPEAEFEREREVVRNEIRAQSSAEGQILPLLLSTVYPQGHAYARSVGGNDEQIASATLADACEFMKKYYAPERATVVVAGGVGMDDAISEIQKWFARIPARPAAARVPVAQFTTEHTTKTVELDTERSWVFVAWPMPPGNTDEGEAARFGVGPTIEQLSVAGLRYDFAYGVDAGIDGGRLAPVFFIGIELKGMDKLDDALEFARNAASQAYRGWDQASYEYVQDFRAREKARFIEQLESLTGRTNSMADFVQYDSKFDFNSNQLYQFHELDKIEKFDIATVGKTIKKTLDWDKAVVLVIKANKEGVKGDTRSKVTFQTKGDQTLDESDVDPTDAVRPQLFKAATISYPGLQQLTLDNGMRVSLLPIKSMPIVTAQLSFRNAGTAADPTSPMMGKAAADFLFIPADAEAQAKTGTAVRCGAGLDEMSCTTHNINVYLDVMLKALDRHIKVGDYAQQPIEDWQKQMKGEFETKSQQEETEFARQVFSVLYGPDHPYTLAALDTPEAANKVHRDALDSFRRKHYVAANATLTVVGDFEPDYAIKQIHENFDSWDKSTADKPVTTKPIVRTGPVYVGVVRSKDSQQIVAEIAYPSSVGIDGQESARQVLANMLDQRTEDIRFKLGSTYGLYMGRRARLGPSAYMLAGGAAVGGTIDAERAGESIKAIRDSFDALRKGDHFNEDFVRARRKLIQGMLGESTVTGQLASELDRIALFGLDSNYYDKLLAQLGTTPPALVKALIKTEIDPNKEVIVLMGDHKHLEKAFAEAGITDVKYVEPEYRK